MNSPVIICGAILACALPCLAQTESASVLETTVVNASGLEGDVQDAPYRVEYQDATDFRRNFVRSLPEALDRTPGVSVQKTANGHGSPYIRGFTGYRTLALIDGVRYNNSIYRDGPSEYYGLIDHYAIDTLELLLGPASTLYGSDAIGGTLFLTTKDSGMELFNDGVPFSLGVHDLRLAAGENSIQNRIEYAFGKGNEWGVHVGLSTKWFGDVDAARLGTLDKTGYDEFAGDLSFERRLNDQWTWKFHHDSLVQNDVWRTHSTIFSKSFAGTDVGDDQRRLKDQQRSLTYLKLQGDDLNSLVESATLTLSFQQWIEEGDHILDDGRRRLEDFDSKMWGVDLEASRDLFAGTLRFGAEVYQDRVNSGRTDFKAGGSLDEVQIQGPVGDDATFTNTGAFAQWSRDFGDRFDLVIGTRYNLTHGDVGKLRDPLSGEKISFSDTWSAFVNSLRLTSELDQQGDWRAWGGISQSFRAPNLADVSRFGDSRSNEVETSALGLDAEHFLTYEAGVKFNNGDRGIDLSYYYTSISDYIASTPTGRTIDGQQEVTKTNSSTGFVHGVDGRAFQNLDENWTTDVYFSWIEGELDKPRGGGREPLSRIAPLSIGGGIQWTSDSGSTWARLDTKWVDKADRLSEGDRGDTQRIPPGGTPGYFLIDVAVGHEVRPGWELSLGVRNALNEAYRVHGSGSNSPGVTVFLSSRLEF